MSKDTFEKAHLLFSPYLHRGQKSKCYIEASTEKKKNKTFPLFHSGECEMRVTFNVLLKAFFYIKSGERGFLRVQRTIGVGKG